MSLRGIYVHADWQERAARELEYDRQSLRLALAAVVLVLMTTLAARISFAPMAWSSFLSDGFVGLVLLGLAAKAAFRSSRIPQAFYLLLPCAFAGLLLSELATRQWTTTPFVSWTVLALVLIPVQSLLPGWVIVSRIVWARGKKNGLNLEWEPLARKAARGLAVGTSIVLFWTLSALYSGADLSLRVDPQLYQQAIYVLGLRSVGEELVFRGIVFGMTYLHLGKGFWTAMLLTLSINLSLYIVTLPLLHDPRRVTLALMGPCLMIMASCALYARDKSLVSPTVSNALFQIVSFALGFG